MTKETFYVVMAGGITYAVTQSKQQAIVICNRLAFARPDLDRVIVLKKEVHEDEHVTSKIIHEISNI